MNKKVSVMPSLEVVIERLPQAILDSVKGPVKILREMPISNTSQRSVKIKSVKSKVVNQDVMNRMPCLQVTLERLPNTLMTNLLAQKKTYVPQKRKVGRPKKINNQFKNQPPMFDFVSV